MLFQTLSPRELDTYRGICPLEIGRYIVRDYIKEVLIGPLEIRKIFSEYSDGKHIYTDSLNDSDFRGPLRVYQGDDGILYMLQDEVYYSISGVLENTDI